MKLYMKVLIFLGIVSLVGIAGFVIYKQIQISNRQATIEQSVVKQKDLVDGITRSQSEFTTKKDLESFIKDNKVNFGAISDDLKKLHAEVTSVNVVTVKTPGYVGSNLPTTNIGPINPNNQVPPIVTCPGGTVIPCPDQDKYGYFKAQQNIDLNEPFNGTNVPIGSAGFSAWQKDPWSIKISPREYNVTNVVGTDENGRQYVYNKFSVSTGGKQYDVKITNAKTEQVVPEASFHWWNPRLFLTGGASVNITQLPLQGSFNAGVTISPFSYGKFRTSPDVNFLQVGLGYRSNSGGLTFIFNPINVNIGKVLPGGIANNTYIGPSLQVNTNKTVFVGANISIGF